MRRRDFITFFGSAAAAWPLAALPGAAHFAVLVNPNNPATESVITEVQAATKGIGRQIEVLSAGTSREIDAAFTGLADKRVDALMVSPNTLFVDRRVQLVTLAVRLAMPTIFPVREFTEAGGLMSYGSSFLDQFHRVLKGEKAANLPVLRATRFELVINLQTARLAENGYVEGKDIAIEFRWADGRYDRLAALATELVARQVEVIAATGGSVSGLAAKSATGTIPIVFSSGGMRVKLGLVASLNRPGGNVTGVNLVFGALGAKRLELLHSLVPAAAAIAMLVNPNYPSAASEVQDVEAAGRTLGLRISIFNARTESEFEPAFTALAEQKAAALLVADDPYLVSQRDRIVQLAARYAVPAMYIIRDFADVGGLMSYGPSIIDAYRLVGVYTGRILKGEKPADLPVVQPTKFDLVINLKTARALGLTIPDKMLALADEVIE